MAKLILMVGNVGTGKTTTTNRLMDTVDIRKGRDMITVSADCLAEMLFNGYYGPNIWTDKHWTLYASIKQYIIREALAKGFSVIVDGTHMAKVNRKTYIDIAKEFDVNVDVYLHTYPDGLKRRIANPKSEHTSPEKWAEIYNNFEDMFEAPTLNEGIDNIIIVKGIDLNE